jgi:hypothetical protein
MTAAWRREPPLVGTRTRSDGGLFHIFGSVRAAHKIKVPVLRLRSSCWRSLVKDYLPAAVG